MPGKPPKRVLANTSRILRAIQLGMSYPAVAPIFGLGIGAISRLVQREGVTLESEMRRRWVDAETGKPVRGELGRWVKEGAEEPPKPIEPDEGGDA